MRLACQEIGGWGMEQIFLQEGWRLREEPLSMQRESVGAVLAQEQGWMDCSLPCEAFSAMLRRTSWLRRME